MLQTNVRNISSLFWVYHRILREHILLFRVNHNSRTFGNKLICLILCKKVAKILVFMFPDEHKTKGACIILIDLMVL
jgi:hypothetical protein